MTKTDVIKLIIDRLDSAVQNDADNQHDMGWDEYLDCMDLELDRAEWTDQKLDACFDKAIELVSDAISDILKGIEPGQFDE